MKAAIAVTIAAATVLSGCIGFDYTQTNMPQHPYKPTIHLHNMWHAFNENGSLAVHFTVVNPTESPFASYKIEPRLYLNHPENGTESSGLDYWAKIRGTLGARSYSEHAWVKQPPEPGHNGTPYYQYALRASTGSGATAYFVSACHNPDGDSIAHVELYGPHPCSTGYSVNRETRAQTPSGFKYILPTDPEYKRLAWECCRLRSLPAYDAQEAWPIPATGALKASRGFPVQEGAVNGSVSARVALPDPAPEGATAGWAARLWVTDAEGAVVGEARLNASQRGAEVRLPRFGALGVYRAHVEAAGAPNATLALEVRVNDGVRPDR